MTAITVTRIEIDGAIASERQLRAAALSGYGHFTAMQVRDRRVRGLELQLARLDAANRELFGDPLDRAAMAGHIRHALGGEIADASVRVVVLEGADAPLVMVTVRPPAGMRASP